MKSTLGKHSLLPLFLLIFCITTTVKSKSQSYPDGFQIETVSTDIEAPAGMVHAENGISYVWELSGKIWTMENGVVNAEPLLDISDQVGYWHDHGMMSMVLDPDFMANGRFYILYVVDRHYLMNQGTEEYDSTVDEYFNATIGRISRFEVNLALPTQLNSNEEFVLIGSTPQNGIPLVTYSHGLGTLIFGKDKTLMCSTGDTNTPGSDYNGVGAVPEGGYDSQALVDGIITPQENVGAFRSQYVNSLCGKILRINRETGEGISSNPFYDADEPNSPRSKVWALGFRNPYRMSLMPNTGSTDPADGNPGSIIIGDVGDWSWEEINLCDASGQNFGWPLFQGPLAYYLFNEPEDYTNNQDYALQNGCGQDFLYFQNLIVPPKENHDEVWIHPCGGTISSGEAIRFVHKNPLISYKNYLDPPDKTVVPIFNANGESDFISVTDPSQNIEGAQDFSGISSIGGVFYPGTNFPEEYVNAYFQADFSGWFRVFHFNEFSEVTKMEHWDNNIGNIIHLSYNPNDQNIYLTGLFPGTIKRISFAGNLKPVIEVSPDTSYGPSPLLVNFDASASFDPEGTTLTFEWDFGDGNFGTGPTPSHEFIAQNDDPESFEVGLTVTDADGKFSTKTLLVSLNNTPPQAEITGFEEGYLYPRVGFSNLNLEAEISDAETNVEELDINWKVYLHHNAHYHLESIHTNIQQTTTIQPLGCGIETFWYRIDLEVTDPQGLQVFLSKEIFPNCNDSLASNIEHGNKAFSIFPNPAFAIANVHFNVPITENDVIDIFSIDGRFVKSHALYRLNSNNEIRISVSDLTPGTYVMRCTLNGETHVRKFIKVRK
jgi:glucose/arabinose dehydrogenase